jgi:hypothetical protein
MASFSRERKFFQKNNFSFNSWLKQLGLSSRLVSKIVNMCEEVKKIKDLSFDSVTQSNFFDYNSKEFLYPRYLHMSSSGENSNETNDLIPLDNFLIADNLLNPFIYYTDDGSVDNETYQTFDLTNQELDQKSEIINFDTGVNFICDGSYDHDIEQCVELTVS